MTVEVVLPQVGGLSCRYPMPKLLPPGKTLQWCVPRTKCSSKSSLSSLPSQHTPDPPMFQQRSHVICNLILYVCVYGTLDSTHYIPIAVLCRCATHSTLHALTSAGGPTMRRSNFPKCTSSFRSSPTHLDVTIALKPFVRFYFLQNFQFQSCRRSQC